MSADEWEVRTHPDLIGPVVVRRRPRPPAPEPPRTPTRPPPPDKEAA